jgi:hypothetical protein
MTQRSISGGWCAAAELVIPSPAANARNVNIIRLIRSLLTTGNSFPRYAEEAETAAPFVGLRLRFGFPELTEESIRVLGSAGNK